MSQSPVESFSFVLGKYDTAEMPALLARHAADHGAVWKPTHLEWEETAGEAAVLKALTGHWEKNGSQVFQVRLGRSKTGNAAGQGPSSVLKFLPGPAAVSTEDRAGLIADFQKRLADRVPAKLLSMEHFLQQLTIPLSSQLTALTEQMVLAALDSAGDILKEFTRRETLHFQQPAEAADRLAYQRIEIREEKFEYIPLNEFTVYQNGKQFLALGITREASVYSSPSRLHLTAWFSLEFRDQILALFGEEFEQRLLQVPNLKGGKFCGDQSVLRIKEKLDWSDLKLEPPVRQKIQSEILDFFNLKDLYAQAGLPFKRGVALYGPPGTGKTMVARLLATTRSETVIWVRAGDIRTLADMDRVFRLARMGAPSILILEDVDFYLQDRDRTSENGLGVANLLAQLDGLQENDGLLVIVTTNRIDTIEKAIIERPGRIDSKIFLGELGRSVIAEILDQKLGRFAKDFPGWNEILPAGVLMTGAQAVELSTMILREAAAAGARTDGQLVLQAEAVKKALRAIDRQQNAQKKAGFSEI